MLAVLCLSVLLAVMSNMALNVALPTLGRQLNAGASSLAWLVDSYVLCFAGLLLPAGAIGDRFGRKGALQCGLLLYIAAALCAAFCTHVGELIAARAVMGVAAALIMPGTLSLLATVFPAAERPQAIAVWASVAGGSVALSITWSGAMLEHFWWGAIFLGMAAIAAAALTAGWFLLPTAHRFDEAVLDPVGAALSIVGVTALLYGFIQAPDDGWSDDRILTAFAIGLLGLTAFIWWERRHARPMLDIAVFSQRRLSLGVLSIAGTYFALFGMYFVLTQYLQLVRGYTPLVAGLCALPAGLAQFAVANLAKPLTARHGLRPVLSAGLAACAAGLLLLATAHTTSPPWTTEVALTLLGTGIGLAMPPATGAVMSTLPAHKAGVGSAVNDLARELGSGFGIGILGSLTIAHYRSRLTPLLAQQPANVSASARAGLGQALAAPGGPRSSAGAAARDAYSSGLDLAMTVGAIMLAAAAATVLFMLPVGKTGPNTATTPAAHSPEATASEAGDTHHTTASRTA